jgi:hypothetical protein
LAFSAVTTISAHLVIYNSLNGSAMDLNNNHLVAVQEGLGKAI